MTALRLAALFFVGPFTAFASEDAPPTAKPPELVLPGATAKESALVPQWWSSMSPGQSSFKDGLTRRREPRLLVEGDLPTFALGTSTLPGFAGDPNKLEDGRDASLEAWADWLAARHERALEPKGRGALQALYRDTARKARAISSPLQGKTAVELERVPAPEREKVQRELAELLVDHLAAERRLLQGRPQAMKERYGRTLGPLKLTPEKRASAVEDALRYLQNFQAPSPSTVPAPGLRPTRLMGKRAAVPLETVQREAIANQKLPPLAVCLAAGTSTRVLEVQVPVATGFLARVYVATHPVTGATWEDLGLPELLHTSILASLWILEEHRETRRTNVCSARGAKPRVTDQVWVVKVLRFAGWRVANGCAGTYGADDVLVPVAEDWFPDEDQVLKHLYGTTPDANGKRCRGRYGAYPVGAYGVNWVCHQACNAFAVKRWNLTPIFYPEDLLFGPYGSLGIADSKAECKCMDGGARHCCIPGNDCCLATTYGKGSGHGAGLASGWNPDKGWIGLECQFTDVPVAFDLQDEEVGSAPDVH